MKTKPNDFASASALQITFSIALILVSAILLVLAAVETPTLGNYPDTSLALSTDTTVTPDAAPTNTTSINVSTSTDFNGTLAGDPMTGVVRVTDAHPAGTYTVTVTAFDSGGETATKTFTLTVTTPVTCNPVSFAAGIDFGVGRNPSSVAVGDFNGDGEQDLAVAHASGNPDTTVSILLGNGNGNFGAATNFGAGPFPESVAVGDFNGDGNQDLAVTNNISPGTVSILLGNGDGTFSDRTNFRAGDGSRSVAVGDFNGDGKQDLAIANNEGPDGVSILLGNGDGTFSDPTNFSAGFTPTSIAMGDFNGDGKQDLAVANYNSNPGTVSILLGNGDGTFSGPTNLSAGDSPTWVAVGDFNGDGKQDLAVAISSSGTVSILLGDGNGNFGAATNFSAGGDPESVAVGDFNGDGKQDLAITIYLDPGTVSILLGDGAGNFSGPVNFGVGRNPDSVAVGDFNGDGKQDLAVANQNSGNVSILLRDCPVSQITPADTTCSQFSSGTAETLGSVQYGRNSGLIHAVAPHNFLYWVPVTAVAGNNIFAITQTIGAGTFYTLFAAVVNGSNVFDSDCAALQRSITQSGNTVRVKFNAPTSGTYYIAIRFNAQNLIGEPVPRPTGTTVHFDFTTTGVPGSTSGLDLVKQE